MKHKLFIRKTMAAGLALCLLTGGATTALADDRDDWDDRKRYKSDNFEMKWDEDALEDLLESGISIQWPNQGKGKGNGKAKGKAKGHYKGDIIIKLDFDDIDEEKHWAMQYIAKLAAKQVFSGYDDGTFRPNKPVSRIEAVITAIRLMGLKEQAESSEEMSTELNFKDTDEIEKKYPQAIGYVAVALENDLFVETETKLQASKSADRLWATILLVKALGLEDEAKAKMNTQLPFKDAREIPAGAVGYVAVAVDKNIVSGYENNTFRPNKPVTRAELAVLLDRAGEEMPEYTDGKVTGEITEISGNAIEVRFGSTVKTYTFHSDAFIHYKGERLDIDELSEGDEIVIRSYEDTIVFVEVVKLQDGGDDDLFQNDFSLHGEVNGVVYSSNGLISKLDVEHRVNNKAVTTTFDVYGNVEIWGDARFISINQDVEVKGENGIIEVIKIANDDIDFEVEGLIKTVVKDQDGDITTLEMYQKINDKYIPVKFNVDSEAEIIGNPAFISSGFTVKVEGEGTTIEKIIIDATNTTFVVDGKVESVTLNENGQLNTIAINQQLNGYNQVTLYNVSANVQIEGNAALLSKGQAVELTGSNHTISKIEIK